MNELTRRSPCLEAMQRPYAGETAVTFRPVQPNDVQPILEMHLRLATDSLYLRYLTSPAH